MKLLLVLIFVTVFFYPVIIYFTWRSVLEYKKRDDIDEFSLLLKQMGLVFLIGSGILDVLIVIYYLLANSPLFGK
jgi:hypothetical protein